MKQKIDTEYVVDVVDTAKDIHVAAIVNDLN